jgi:predicted DNA-binding transcriptional regulator AlpA
MTTVDPAELIGQAEAAELSGLSLSGFKLARAEGRAPEPVAVVSYFPLWTRSQIEHWAADRAARRP